MEIFMTSNFRRFEYLSWPQAEQAAQSQGSTLIWPFGACEQHGPQLPLITDTLFAERIVFKVLERLPSTFPIWSLPTQSIGFSPEHLSFPGTISLPANFLLDLINTVGKQVAEIGFRRLILFNAHGGQIGLLQTASRQLRAQYPQMAVLPCFLWQGVSELDQLIPHAEIENGLHAGLAETSLMLAIDPQLVGNERPIDGEHNSPNSFATPPRGWSMEGSAPCAWLTKDLSNSGVIGDSRKANSAIGETIEKILINHWENLLISLLESDWPPS